MGLMTFNLILPAIGHQELLCNDFKPFQHNQRKRKERFLESEMQWSNKEFNWPWLNSENGNISEGKRRKKGLKAAGFEEVMNSPHLKAK